MSLYSSEYRLIFYYTDNEKLGIGSTDGST